jgi:chromate transport protein ChrA
MTDTTQPPPDFREALRFWPRLGFISFGGPAGQIAILHRELVERKRWITEERFLAGFAFCTVVTTYATFLPSLTLVFLGAPYVDHVQSLPRLAGAIRAIGAAVTAVIASLGLDYGLAVLLPRDSSAPDFFALVTMVAAAIALRLGLNLGAVLLGGVEVGFLHHFIS